MNEVADDFVEAWLSENEAVLLEIVAIQGDDPTTPYGAALARAMAFIPTWMPSRQEDSAEPRAPGVSGLA